MNQDPEQYEQGILIQYYFSIVNHNYVNMSLFWSATELLESYFRQTRLPNGRPYVIEVQRPNYYEAALRESASIEFM